MSNSSPSAFEVVSDSTLTRGERLRQRLDRTVLAPLRIMAGDWRAVVGGAIVATYLLVGTVGTLFVREPAVNQAPRGVGAFANLAYPLGTTLTGESILAQIVHATPPMLEMILSGGVFVTVVATLVGSLAGYSGGRTDRVLSTITDMMMSIPGLPLVMVLAVLLSPEQPWLVGIVITVNWWAGLARQIRSQVLTIRTKEYIEASQTMGLSTPTILRKDVIPNIMPYVTVNFVNAARGVIFNSVGLYFLGVLPYEDIKNWGLMMKLAYDQGAMGTPELYHWIFAPTITIVILSLGLILLAQGMDRVFNPRVRARHAKTTGTERAAEDGAQSVGGQL